MKLYYLNFDDCDYDQTNGFIIRAKNEKEARELANSRCSDEGKIWTDKQKVSCKHIKVSGKSEIILIDFLNG